MNKLSYLWKYWIKPMITITDPNSATGLRLRAGKLIEDGADPEGGVVKYLLKRAKIKERKADEKTG